MNNGKTSLKVILTATIFILSFIEANAQTVEWTKTFGSTWEDGGESMVITSDGGIVIAGFKSINFEKNVLLMKTDAAGNELWTRIYDIAVDDWARSLRQTSDGGFIITGMTEVSQQTHDPFLIKTDSQGNVEWQQQYDYGLGDDDRAHDVWQTSDGGYIVAGQTWLFHGSFANYDMYIFKTDMNGNLQWKKIFYRENSGNDVALGVQQYTDGGYIIGGFTQSSTWASYVIRTNSLGEPIWSNIYPGSWQSECYDIRVTPDGGFILTGTETSFQTDGDVLLMKLNSDGAIQWKKVYGNTFFEMGQFIYQLQNGYLIAGQAANSTGYDMYIMKTNASGDSIWTKKIGGSGDDRAFSIAAGSSGSVYTTGWTWSYGLGSGDVYLVKLLDPFTPVELTTFTARTNNDDIILEWSTATEVNNYGFEIERKAADHTWQNIGFVKGAGTIQEISNYTFTDNSPGNGKYVYRLKQIDHERTFDYSSEVEVEMTKPLKFTLEQNYPNPFNPSTTIEFTIPDNVSNVQLDIYNSLGEKVAGLVNTQLPAGIYSYTWDASEAVSGVYIYKLVTNNFVSSKKMLLLK